MWSRYGAFLPMTGLLLLGALAHGEVMTKTVEYSQKGAILEGFLAYDPAVKGKVPGVLVVHQWRGLTDYEKGRARQLAGMGYVALAADIYGKGIRPEDNQAAQKLVGTYYADRQLLRDRVRAGLDFLAGQPQVDPSRVAAIGYCFGGTTVLELARSGAPLAGVVCFHGGLDTTQPARPGDIKCRVLAIQGADDPYMKPETKSAFETEMRGGHFDWQIIYLGGAVHSYTVPTAGNDPSTGAAYDERADRRSWQYMKDFFAEIFK